MNKIHHILSIFINQSFYIKKKESPTASGPPCEKYCYKIMEETVTLQSSEMNFDGLAVSFGLYINSNHLLLDAFPDFLERK